MRVLIDSAGRVVVPKPIRERLRLHGGFELELIEEPDGITLRRPELSPRLVREGKLLVHTGKLGNDRDWSRLIEEERDARNREIWSL